MSLRRILRTIAALSAAYAVVLQSILLAAALPPAGAPESLDRAICSILHSADGELPAPIGSSHDCVAACLAAGCGSAGDASARAASVAEYTGAIAPDAAFAAGAPFGSYAFTPGAYHSRAPPLR
jgi:hypothetical protein